jgi:mannose-6-phosphate isomerase-like protein (cupin superfamily)
VNRPSNLQRQYGLYLNENRLVNTNASETNRKAVEQIEHQGQALALIVRNEFSKPGVNFFTSNELSQQLAHMCHPAGKVIPAHVHNPVHRTVAYTQETLFIKRGRLRVDFYDADRIYLESRVLGPGDVILLIRGGHGFEVLEDLEMIEVKQGPYAGENDKTCFEGRPPAIRIVSGSKD